MGIMKRDSDPFIEDQILSAKGTEALTEGTIADPYVPITDPSPIEHGLEKPDSPPTGIDDMPFVKDPAISDTAVADWLYPQTTNLLSQFITGHPISVVYYNQQNVSPGLRSNTSDSVGMRHIGNNAYLRFDNLTLTLSEPFKYTTDEKNSQSTIRFSGVLPNVFTPLKGDIVLADIDKGITGVFVIVSVKPATYFTNSVFFVGGYLLRILDDTFRAVLRNSTIEVYNYDPNAGPLGSGGMVTSDTTSAVNELNDFKKASAGYFWNAFYNRDHNTILRPDGVYDPYVVTFCNSEVEYVEGFGNSFLQHNVEAGNSYTRTIWSRLQSAWDKDLDGLVPRNIYLTWEKGFLSTYMTSRNGMPYVSVDYNVSDDYDKKQQVKELYRGSTIGTRRVLRKDALDELTDWYVLSKNFYACDKANMTDFEKIVYEVITTKKYTNANHLLKEYIRKYKRWDAFTIFYHLPILWLIADVCINSLYQITPGQSVVTVGTPPNTGDGNSASATGTSGTTTS